MNIRLWKANAAEKLGVVSPTSSSSCFISELQLQSITHPRQLAASWWAGSGVAAGQPTAVRPPPLSMSYCISLQRITGSCLLWVGSIPRHSRARFRAVGAGNYARSKCPDGCWLRAESLSISSLYQLARNSTPSPTNDRWLYLVKRVPHGLHMFMLCSTVQESFYEMLGRRPNAPKNPSSSGIM